MSDGILTVVTTYSTYEVNRVDGLVRRTEGIHQPTPRQWPDGQWQPYKHIATTDDNCLLFTWGDGTQTVTSPIKEVW